MLWLRLFTLVLMVSVLLLFFIINVKPWFSVCPSVCVHVLLHPCGLSVSMHSHFLVFTWSLDHIFLQLLFIFDLILQVFWPL